MDGAGICSRGHWGSGGSAGSLLARGKDTAPMPLKHRARKKPAHAIFIMAMSRISEKYFVLICELWVAVTAAFIGRVS